MGITLSLPFYGLHKLKSMGFMTAVASPHANGQYLLKNVTGTYSGDYVRPIHPLIYRVESGQTSLLYTNQSGGFA